ncbi:MAG TPA: hypothetical protein VLB79_06890 [Solirubrobacterales bacterium]|nr:hypothetical protein [Solirubrobacterales bacterium]
MLGRHLCLLALGAVLLAGCTDDGSGEGTTLSNAEGITRQIAGSWTANLHQEGLAPFVIAVDISADGRGRVAYTGIECGGEWTLHGVEQSMPPRYVFDEAIHEGAGGNCKGTGTVSLAPIQRHSPNEPAYNRLGYRFSGGGVTSRGLLRRIHPGGLNPIFKQAGVTPP